LLVKNTIIFIKPEGTSRCVVVVGTRDLAS
jgi:hypothetical protein